MGITKVQASGLDLSADWNFTGTVTGTPAGGAMRLIKTVTASASSSLSFVNGSNGVVLDSTYKAYKFVFKNIHPANDNVSFHFQGSTDNGSNYNVTMTTSAFLSTHDEADTYTTLTYLTNQDQAQGTNYQFLAEGIGNDNDQSNSGELWLYNPSSTTYVKHFLARVNKHTYDNYSADQFYAGYFNTTSAINAIDFKMSSGNIDDGQISLYGIN